jgi:hypothetical protein
MLYRAPLGQSPLLPALFANLTIDETLEVVLNLILPNSKNLPFIICPPSDSIGVR